MKTASVGFHPWEPIKVEGLVPRGRQRTGRMERTPLNPLQGEGAVCMLWGTLKSVPHPPSAQAALGTAARHGSPGCCYLRSACRVLPTAALALGTAPAPTR